jgi:hypothetical protein
MKVNGVMIFNMEKAKKVGQMALCIKENIWLVKNMVVVSTAGMMDQDMTVNGMRTKSKEWELIVG